MIILTADSLQGWWMGWSSTVPRIPRTLLVFLLHCPPFLLFKGYNNALNKHHIISARAFAWVLPQETISANRRLLRGF